MGETAAAHQVEFVVGVGDNFYMAGVSAVDDTQLQEKFEVVDLHTLRLGLGSACCIDFYTNSRCIDNFFWLIAGCLYTSSSSSTLVCVFGAFRIDFFEFRTSPNCMISHNSCHCTQVHVVGGS